MTTPSDDISWWYCCLNVAERTVVLNTCEGFVLTLFTGIPLPVWDAFWLATDHNTADYKSVFRSLYHLDVVSTEVDGEPVEVIAPRDGFLPLWVGWSLFVVTPSAACLEGCGQSSIP